MPPYPQHALLRIEPASDGVVSSPTPPHGSASTSASVSSAWPGLALACEEESTQTEGASSSDWGSISSAASMGLEGSGEGGLSSDGGEASSSSVMARLSRGVVGRLFAPERQDRSTQTMKDPLTSETEKLAFDIVFFTIGRRTAKTSDEIVLCLRRSVQQMLDNHALVFNGMVSRLDLNSNSDLNQGFQDLANVLFSNNEVTWNKIIALFAFAARLALYCDEHHFENKMFDVASNLSQCAIEHLTPFLRRHGGWATLCQAFPAESDYESKIWTSLVITGLGLTMFATFLAWQR
ncbi:hypothetical protein TCAL_12083 [Tigriopus californicus]|uniref:Bcl-2 Bcl-2 homology region 1-3 domain-containing protein n=1 Tax=Tigriopus californicus TaxID=6832 RepID=A0A553NR23_TIGCA|nr:uncharacterized protein LOC131879027 [Tigriopus californicus]TRY67898.1 hypothetical protein TCAL_12083 [Tigriopus californicus]